MNDDLLNPIVRALSHAAPLDPGHDRDTFRRLYVDGLHPGPFGGALAQLKREIESTAGGHQIYLFSGTVGSGKSTELLRLASQLSDDYYVAVVNITDYLNPEQELRFADLLLAMVMGLLEVIAGPSNWDSSLLSVLDGLKGLLGAKVTIDSLTLPVVKLNLKQPSALRDQLRQRFAESPGEFISEAHELFRRLATRAGQERHVLVVDSLEHFGGRRGKNDPILASLRAVFSQHTDAMRIPDWQTVYSVPPLLPKLAPGLLAVAGARLYQLTSAHVFADRSDQPDDQIVNRLVDLVDRRCNGQAIRQQFIDDAELRRIIVNSGGDLRDLMRLLKMTALFAFESPHLPVGPAVVDAAFDEWRNAYLPLAADVTTRLADVRKNRIPTVATEDDWFGVMSDLAEKRVLLYRNGNDWYDVHPLLRDALDKRAPVASGAAP
jgi:hypothetical protein